MEYCKEGDLEKYLQDHGVFNEEDGKTIMKQIFQGLEFLHGESFTHRDLKPSVCEPIG
jgi:serine/threonine protein kinase